eukprot:scaffold368244_cov18-Prasinocladus_malaysianus.AAC.1
MPRHMRSGVFGIAWHDLRPGTLYTYGTVRSGADSPSGLYSYRCWAHARRVATTVYPGRQHRFVRTSRQRRWNAEGGTVATLL